VLEYRGTKFNYELAEQLAGQRKTLDSLSNDVDSLVAQMDNVAYRNKNHEFTGENKYAMKLAI
jgi:cell division protein FtsB